VKWARYVHQTREWPKSGRHILAQFDASSIYVYQAYRPVIARFAVANQGFGGEFSFSRMSWIKPNFLWMMYRAGWASKEGQEHILAVRITRSFFDELLKSSVASAFDPVRFSKQEEWKSCIESSEVRLQWDPDHDPHGAPLERRALQLGLRGSMLRRYSDELISIEDISSQVAEQRELLSSRGEELQTPEEHLYVPADPAAATAVGLDRMDDR
jgi:hypothetical protein